MERGLPQHGIPVCVTSCAHRLATCVNASASPIFLEEHGTWTATLSRTLVHSSLSSMKWRTNSTGSYRENLVVQKILSDQWSSNCEGQGRATFFKIQLRSLMGDEGVGGCVGQDVKVAHLSLPSDRPFLICERQGDVSQTMGILPPWDAARREASSSAPFTSAASLNPRESKSIPQHELFRPCTHQQYVSIL